MLNNVALMGRITRDPELRHTQAGLPVASYTLAVNRDFGASKEADFIDVVAWQKSAEFANTYFRKGHLAAILGRLQSRKWTDRDGNNRVSIEVVAERQYFAESKNKDDSVPPQNIAGNPAYEIPGAFTMTDDDAELPF